MTDQDYLRESQYRNAENLNARIRLHQLYSVNPYGWQQWVFDQFELPPIAHLLELGCGPGTLWSANRRRIPAEWRLTLSDLSVGMLQEAEQNLQGLACTIDYRVIDAQSIPLPEVSRDAVIANHMLYHVPDRAQALAEIARVLKPGGRLYAATNGREHLQELDDLWRRCGIEPPSSDLSFTLEEGGAELSACFASVDLRRHENALRVTEAQPLIAFLLSEPFGAPMNEDQIGELRRIVEQEIARNGAFHITKSTGLFVAAKA